MDTTKKRYAFISYNHKDAKWAKWLQEKLESYKLPADIHNEFENSRYLRPVFRDKTDLNTGVLANELRKELEESKMVKNILLDLNHLVILKIKLYLMI